MTMHKALHPRDDVDRLYVSRKEGGRGLASIEDSIGAIQRLKDYIEKHRGRLITVTRNNTDNMKTNSPKITRIQKWEAKQLYGHFKQQTSNITHEKTWTWLKKGNLKRENESLLITAQDDVIKSNYIKARCNKIANVCFMVIETKGSVT